MAEPVREQRLPENAAVRALFGRVDGHGTRLSKVEETLKHVITHKSLLAYAGLSLLALGSAGWALFSAYEARVHDQMVEVKADNYRQEVKVDAIKDMLMGQSAKTWPATPAPPPEVRAVIEKSGVKLP